MTPAIWSDVAADLALAVAEARRAKQKAGALGALPEALREDRELAVGKHLHDAYSAAEKALERLVALLDGALPQGRSFHQDLLDRAARPLPGVREALISEATRRDMRRLLAFRHVYRHPYGQYLHALAEPNVTLGAEAIPRLAGEVEAAARAAGLLA